MEIRNGKLSDLEELHENFVHAKGLTHYSINNDYMYIVEDKGKIIAFLYGDKTIFSNSGILLGLEVLKEYRHKGIATNLTKRFENDLKHKYCKQILVFFNNNDNQLEFYKKVGFKREDFLCSGLKEIK